MNPGKAFMHVKSLASLFVLMGAVLSVNSQPAQAETLQQVYDCSAQTSVPQSECEALVALYNSTNGDGWTDKTGWFSGNVCTWIGVICSGGDVEIIDLRNNNLTGILDVDFLNFNDLWVIWLDDNQLTGDFSSIVDKMPVSLKNLRLNSNAFNGTIPTTITNLTDLRTLDVSNNPDLIGTIPIEITGLALNYFNFAETNLCEPQDAVFQTWFSGLTGTSSGIPCFQGCTLQTSISAAECNALVSLYNNAAGASWTNDTNWLFSDEVCSWYGVTCGSGAVDALDLNGNNLVGSIPTDIGNLSNLTQLNLSNNSLSGSLPGEIGNIVPLADLNISSNTGLTGSLPANLTNLGLLTTFDFSTTDLCEPQDSAFQTWLSGIAVTDSGIACQVDCAVQTSVSEIECNALVALFANTGGSGWTNKTNWVYTNDVCTWNGVTCGSGAVTALDLNGNNLVGSIPTAIDGLSNLTLLDLSNNQLSGALPGEIGNIAPLNILNISSNTGLTGSLPANLTNLGALTNFNFSSTDLCEPQDSAFQTWLGNLTSVNSTEIPCYDCAAQSSVPQSECEALVALYTSTNGNNWIDSSGWFVSDVCNWYGVSCFGGSVAQIFFVYNNLTGTLPAEIGNLPNLEYLYLGGSPISGSLPPELGNLGNLIELWIFETDINGSLPASLGNLSKLDTLWVYDNQINGSIPASLGNLSNLSVLVLSSNQLNGDLPPELGIMTELILLAVDDNNLSGTLPTELGNLTILQYLLVNDNNFSGPIPGSYVNLINLSEFNTQNTALCMPNNNTALINWYEALDFGPLIYFCNPIVPTSTNTPTPTSGGGGSGPTSTSLPTNTPTITFTPTITRTPTLVAPFQTLTQMAWKDTQAADPFGRVRTATTAASATLYYYNQLGTQTIEPGALFNANGGSGLAVQDVGSKGQSSTGGADTKTGTTIPPLLVWSAIIAAVIIISLFLILDQRKRKRINRVTTKEE